VAVENPTDRPRRSFETKRTGRLGPKTRAKDEASERMTARWRSGRRPV
jgi:hypothetical protein